MNSVKLENRNLIYRNLLCFYTKSTNYQKEKLGNNPFTISSTRINYLGINRTKRVKDLYSEKYKTLVREIEDDTNKWKYII